MEKSVDLKDLGKHYMAHNLTQYLQTLSDEELEHAMGCILCDDIVDDRVNIYSAIKNEMEYRESDKSLSSRKK